MATDTTDAVRAVKLTKAQSALLFDLTMGSVLVGASHQPALDLVALKLATKKRVPMDLIRVAITRSGKEHPQACLADAQKDGGRDAG